ncbi:MAG: cation-translocating P-type ATPase [Oscillospiraceae bacterium]|nr:cation-translocating P-type ATPase [Oscillospiraceae bacterium]
MRGLSSEEAARRQQQEGANTLAEPPRSHPIRILLAQFQDLMVLILMGAAGISAFLGEYTDAATIGIIVVLNAILGFIQEYRTEQTLLALRNMTAPTAKVYRDDSPVILPAAQLVTEDLILLEAGDRVPADACILSCSNLQAEESILTGESCAVEKSAHTEQDGAVSNAIGRTDVLYAGTSVTRGSAEAKIIAIGKQTQMGQISQLLSEIDSGQTPLQKRLDELGKVVTLLCGIVCVMVFLAGVLRGEPIPDMLMTGITIAIAAIPEGLPATVTIALALAVRRMLKRNALVNRLHAVETLGCASVICTDKTGTITENKMTVCALTAGMEELALSGNGWQKSGTLTDAHGAACNPHTKPDLAALLRCAVLCNHAKLKGTLQNTARQRGSLQAKGEWDTVGDPTEIALLVAAAKCGFTADGFSRYPLVHELPFESETRSMTVFCAQPMQEMLLACRKGAVDAILPQCSFYREQGKTLPLTPQKRAAILAQAEAYAEQALRVLAFAEKDCKDPNAPLQSMVFLGLMAMMDPPRAQAKAAVADCVRAGIKVMMLTGDHAKTAAAVAKQAGIPNGHNVLTGAELDAMSDTQLADCVAQYGVFARVTPSHKLRLVKVLRSKGKIVTMTGDGVNDAPAVKEADIGVAMGKNGTDVTRQAADVILLDDRFDTLAAAVEQGRTVYANIRKFVRYLLACNIGEVLTMFLGLVMGMPMVLLPTQILLVNLMTDGLPAIALGLEPPSKDIMRKPPRNASESFFAHGLLSKIIFRGIFIALSTLGAFTTILRLTGSVETARTGALVTLILSQLLHVFECKKENGTLFTVPYFSNGKLLLAVLVSLAVTASALWCEPIRLLFGTTALYGKPLLCAVLFSFAVPLASTLPVLLGGWHRHDAVSESVQS